MLDEIKSFEQPFEALILIASDDLQLLMKTASGDLASDEVLLMTSALQEHFVFRTSFLQMLQTSFLLIPLLSFVLSEYALKILKIDTTFLSLVLHTWTNINISNWQFLILCYHQNSKGNVKYILFQHEDLSFDQFLKIHIRLIPNFIEHFYHTFNIGFMLFPLHKTLAPCSHA